MAFSACLRSFRRFAFPVVLFAGLTFSYGIAGPLIERAAAVRYESGMPPPFLGVLASTEPTYGLGDVARYMEEVIANNPHLDGFTIRLQWRVLHPEKDRVDWAGLEKVIATAAAADKLVIISLIPGGASPDWIYGEGVLKAGPLRIGSRIITTPVPWDPKFMELYTADLEGIAQRYADDPRLFGMTVLGHNFNYLGEEMHAPSAEAFRIYGWTPELVEGNWRHWIDTYDRLFPKKKLMLVPSQTYRGADGLSRNITGYFSRKTAGRGVFQTHQLTGRDERLGFGPALCKEFSSVTPASHEVFSSMIYIPARTGTFPMYVHNVLQVGRPPFLQIWGRDAEKPDVTLALKAAWKEYGSLSLVECKARLVREGLYIERATGRPMGYTPYDLSRLPPPGYPGHGDPFLTQWAPYR